MKESTTESAKQKLYGHRERVKHVHDFMPVIEEVTDTILGEQVTTVMNSSIGHACACGVWLDEYKGSAGFFVEGMDGRRAYYYGSEPISE